VRVLVIDDEPDVLLVCRVNLQAAGHDVLEAPDGESGLELAFEKDPEVIVLDVMLPGRDGLSIIGDLSADERTVETPVILLSAKTQDEDVLAGWQAGCTEYVTKPFLPADLLATIDRVARMSTSERRERRERELARLSRDL
jgi:two-component system alkaline phosphatase synthesis response regulator PhoP